MKYYEKGNFELQTQNFSGTPTAPAYSGQVKNWYGLMEISVSAAQDTAYVAADDIADYLAMNPPMVMTGTIKVTGMKITEYEHLFNVIKDTNNMYLFGSQKLAKEVGLSFKNTGYDDAGNLITNKFILFRTVVKLPNITTASIDEDGTTIRDFTMDVRASYIKYTIPAGQTGEGTVDFATYGVIDSTNANWDNLKDTFFIPYETNLPYSVTLTKDANTTVTITKNGLAFNPSTEKVHSGDILVITVTYASGYEKDTLTVGGVAYTSGTSYTVGNANVAIVATAKVQG